MREKVHREKMDTKAHRRHDISDRLWNGREGLLTGMKGRVRRYGRDNRQFINAVFCILRTGVSWRDLPLDFGD
jgi:transposase